MTSYSSPVSAADAFIALSHRQRNLAGDGRQSSLAQARANPVSGTEPMISIPRVRKAIDESPRDDAPEHEWAEYNLPVTPATRPLIEDASSDELAFLGFAVDTNPQPLEN